MWQQQSGSEWKVHIYDSNGYEKSYFYTDDSNAAAKYTTQTLYLKKGTYYYYVVEYFINAYWELYNFTIQTFTSKPKTSNIAIKNNKGKKDTITVKGLKKGAVVQVYNSKSKVIAKGTSKGSSITLSVKQLGKNSRQSVCYCTKPWIC